MSLKDDLVRLERIYVGNWHKTPMLLRVFGFPPRRRKLVRIVNHGHFVWEYDYMGVA